MQLQFRIHSIVFVTALLGLSNISYAGTQSFSTFLNGPLGLNTVPNARMDEQGTIRTGLSTLDPYWHSYIGFQIAKPLYIQLRQSAETSSLSDSPARFYPGLDFKLRLAKESAWRPEISLGLQSAFGHKRMGGEYLALSKRWNHFDFTAGLGWGRMGSAGHFSNPFKGLSSHFANNRNFNTDSPHTVKDWFTGDRVGLFGGIEYFTPLDGLSVKADWGADRFAGEQSISGFTKPAPWSLALNYQPKDWIDLSAGIAGTDKVMARLSLQSHGGNWPGRYNSDIKSSDPNSGQISLYGTNSDQTNAFALFDLTPFSPTAQQIGRAARQLSDHTGDTTRRLTVRPAVFGLQGPNITLSRRDLDAALHKNGSPEEIWQDAEIKPAAATKTSSENRKYPWITKFRLDTQLSLSEEDSGLLYRSGLVLDIKRQWPYGFVTGNAARLNIGDNLHRLAIYRTASSDPVRSDVDLFASRRIGLDRSFLSWLKSINTETHMAVTGGLLEEMYSGAGAEILYRPFGKTWAVGAEGWRIFRRDPGSTAGIISNHAGFTGHINFWYEPPGTNLTLFGKAGRYLGEDVGATAGLQTTFDNGAILKGFLTTTDKSDPDIFGDTTHLYGGLQLTLPFGHFKYTPDGTDIRIKAEPFGRDAGQTLDNPLPLYKLTEPMSYRRIAQSWKTILN